MTVTPSPGSRVAIYARQSVLEEQGIQQQLEDCRQEAVRRNLLVVREFADNDTSGSTTRGSKTDWAQMLKSFDENEFDTLIVTETSRLTRSLTDVLDITRPRRNIRVVVIRQGIDTAIDDFQLKLLVLVAENEVKLKAQRAARYATERRKVGHPTPGRTPYGYRWVPASERDEKGTRYAIEPQEAENVVHIFSEFHAGATLGQIGRDLSASGRLTRHGLRWHASTVRRILLNPLYAALLPPAQPSGEHSMAAIDLDACTSGAWEPLVTRDDVVASRAKLLAVKPKHNGTSRRWLLSGIATCAVCDAPVKSSRAINHPTRRKDGTVAPAKSYHAYRCHFNRNGDIIDQFVSEVCIQRLSQIDLLNLFPSQDHKNELSELYVRREALLAERENIFALVGSDSSRLAAARTQLEIREEALREIDVLISTRATSHPLSDLWGVTDVRGWWETSTLARRRAIVQLLMTVAIKPVGPGKRPKLAADVLQSLEIRPLV